MALGLLRSQWRMPVSGEISIKSRCASNLLLIRHSTALPRNSSRPPRAKKVSLSRPLSTSLALKAVRLSRKRLAVTISRYPLSSEYVNDVGASLLCANVLA